MLDQSLLNDARGIITPAIRRRRDPLSARVSTVIQEMVNRGMSTNSGTTQLIHQLIAEELIARNKLAWDSLERTHSTYGSPITQTLASDLKHEVGIHRFEAKTELDSILRKEIMRTWPNAHQSYPVSLNLERAVYDAESETDGLINLYVAGLKQQQVSRDQNWTSLGDAPLIFVSCGQYAPNERKLGQDISKLIDTELPPCRGYFAENQSSLEGLSQHILGAMNRCIGFVAVMHRRGLVRTSDGEHHRASIWIEQEIAIAAFLQQALRRKLAVAVYFEKGIKREGIRDQILSGAKEFQRDEEILEDFRAKIKDGAFTPS